MSLSDEKLETSDSVTFLLCFLPSAVVVVQTTEKFEGGIHPLSGRASSSAILSTFDGGKAAII
jgi:hypothetical protein